MPYVPLQIGNHVTKDVSDLIRGTVDPAFREIRLVLLIEDKEQEPSGSMQLSLAKLLLSATDGAATMFNPDVPSIGPRFKSFIRDNFPWDADCLAQDEACKFLWKSARCALIHCFGLYRQGDLRKFGRVLTMTDARLEQIETDLAMRPSTKPFIERNTVKGKERTCVWIESYYWALRKAITKALDTPEKVAAVETWIKSGKWVR